MRHHLATLAALAFGAIACSTGNADKTNDTAAAPDTAATASAAPAATAQGEWRPLIDSSLSAWRGYKEQTVPSGWHVADGVLSKTVSVNDLVSRDQFGNFELEWDWKVSPGGNAGVFYRGNEDEEKIYWTAPEYQLLDDARHEDGKSRLTAAGSAYAVYPSPAGIVKPANEWNSSRIVVNGNHVEHWLNGQKVVEYELGSADWQAKVKASKFKDWPKYGTLSTGHLAIQGDHEGPLSIRNMRVRTLP
jgi:hypothetical protein